MRPEEFFNDFVLPNLAEFQANPTDRRLVPNAAVAMYHMIGYVAESVLSPEDGQKETREKVGEVRKALRCSDFKLVDDLAHAYKHCVAKHRERERSKICYSCKDVLYLLFLTEDITLTDPRTQTESWSWRSRTAWADGSTFGIVWKNRDYTGPTISRRENCEYVLFPAPVSTSRG